MAVSGSAAGACPGTVEAFESDLPSSVVNSSIRSAASRGEASAKRSATFGALNVICFSFVRVLG